MDPTTRLEHDLRIILAIQSLRAFGYGFASVVSGRRARGRRPVRRPGRARLRCDPGRQRAGLDRDRARRGPTGAAPGVRPPALGDERGRGRVRALRFGGGAGARGPHRHPVDRRERVGAAHLARAGDDGRRRARDPRPGLRSLQRGRVPGGSRRRARRGRTRPDPRADPEPPDRPALAAGARGRGDRVRRPHTPALARDRRPNRTLDGTAPPFTLGGEPPGDAVRAGRVRRWVRRVDVRGVLVRPAVRGERRAHGPGAVRFGAAPGDLVDRVGPTRHPVRPPADDGVHPPAVERPARS